MFEFLMDFGSFVEQFGVFRFQRDGSVVPDDSLFPVVLCGVQIADFGSGFGVAGEEFFEC